MNEDKVRKACVDLLEDKQFDKLIEEWVKDGEFDDAVIYRAEDLIERGELDDAVANRTAALLERIR